MGGNKKGEERKFEMQIFEQINPYKSRCIFFSLSLCLQHKISLTALDQYGYPLQLRDSL